MEFFFFLAIWVAVGLAYELGRSYERRHGKENK